MPDGNDGNDQPAVIDLIDSAVVADTDAPGVAASELLAAGRAGIMLEFQQLLFDPGGHGIRQLAELLLRGGQDENGIVRPFGFCVFLGWHRAGGWGFLFSLWLYRRRGYP